MKTWKSFRILSWKNFQFRLTTRENSKGSFSESHGSSKGSKEEKMPKKDDSLKSIDEHNQFFKDILFLLSPTLIVYDQKKIKD